jgi:hypothetical protein
LELGHGAKYQIKLSDIFPCHFSSSRYLHPTFSSVGQHNIDVPAGVLEPQASYPIMQSGAFILQLHKHFEKVQFPNLEYFYLLFSQKEHFFFLEYAGELRIIVL